MKFSIPPPDNPLPRNLLLTPEGELKMKNGSSVQEYLKSYMEHLGAEQDEEVSLAPTDLIDELRNDSFTLRTISV